MTKWFKRWRRIGYRELYYRHFGGAHEGDKGCDREYHFLLEITSGWQHAFSAERSLRLEAEQALRDNMIEVPTEVRTAALMERLKRGRSSS